MRNKLLLTILTLLPLQAAAQRISSSIGSQGRWQLSKRWHVAASLASGYQMAPTDAVWINTSLGGDFNVYDSLYIFASCSVTGANYVDIDNKDYVWQLTEGLRINTSRLFSHIISIDERRLVFRPSDYYISCSRLSYECLKTFQLDDDRRWQLSINARTTLNINSDVSDNRLLQRFAAGLSINRKFLSNGSLQLHYEYMAGGTKQTYVNDCHDLHRISLFWLFNKW